MLSPAAVPIVLVMATGSVQDSMRTKITAQNADDQLDVDSTEGLGNTTVALDAETPAAEPANNEKRTVGSVAESPGISISRELCCDQDDYLLQPSEADSPLPKKTVDSHERSSVPPVPLVRSISLGTEDIPYCKISHPKGLITYSGRRSRSSRQLASLREPSVLQEHADDGHEMYLMATSAARDEHDVAYETAARSTKRRKLSTSNDEAEPEVEMIAVAEHVAEAEAAGENESFAQIDNGDEDEDKIQTDAHIQEAAVKDEATATISDDVDQEEAEKPPKRRSRKQPMPFNTEADETITVAHVKPQTRKGGRKKAASPQVVLPSDRSRIMPASTAPPATSMSSKVTKILISQSSMKETGEYNKTAAFISKHHKSIINHVPSKQTNFICVVPTNGDLKKTSKILRTLAFGKLVVTDAWLKESMKVGEFLEPTDYIHADLENTLGADRGKLFGGLTVFFTANLYSELKANNNWDPMYALARNAGASIVKYGKALKGLEAAKRCGDRIVFLASDPAKDRNAKELADEGYDVYSKGLLTTSVLLGQLDLKSEEFLLLEGKNKTVEATAAAEEEAEEDELVTAEARTIQEVKAASRPEGKTDGGATRKRKRRSSTMPRRASECDQGEVSDD